MSMPYLPVGSRQPPHLRYDLAQGRPVDVRSFGAIGDGTDHYLTEDDLLAHTEWYDGEVCRYTTSDTWDYVGIQEAIYSAYGTPGNKHSLGYRHLNREIYLPAGKYRINRTLFLVNATGVIFAGAGRFTTHLAITVKDQPLLETNMVYSVIRDLMFGYEGNQACTAPTALVEWTWDGAAGTSAGGLAQLSVYDCEFLGGAWPNTIGFRAARDGPQGDNVIFQNCFFADCRYAAFANGDGAFNVLNVGFIACNFQSCFQYGILLYGGNVNVFSCSFQNGHFSTNPPQRGFDIRLVSNAGSVSSIIHGCRSESSAFLHADSYHAVDVRACSNVVTPTAWVPGTAYALGAVVCARSEPPNASPFMDGRPYVCSKAGTSGGSPPPVPPPSPPVPDGAPEPEWDGSSLGVIDGECVWAVSGPHTTAAAWQAVTVYAVGALVVGDDGNDYVCVVPGESAAAEPNWNGHPGLTDNTVKWVVYNYNTIELDAGSLENCSFPWGRIKLGSLAPTRIMNTNFSRDDWLWQGPAPIETVLGSTSQHNILAGNLSIHATGITSPGSAAFPYAFPDYDGYPDHVVATSHFYLPMTMPLLWARNGHRTGQMHRCARDVGFWPPKGHYADGTAEDLATNVVGILGALAPRHAAEVANTAGTDLLLQGGLGRGSAAGGAIRLRTAAAGAAGSNLNLPVDRVTVTPTRLNISGLPTSNPGVAGDIWNDGGVLKVSAG